jgi:hypothetical protein
MGRLEYVDRHVHSYHIVWWIPAALGTFCARLAGITRLTVPPGQGGDRLRDSLREGTWMTFCRDCVPNGVDRLYLLFCTFRRGTPHCVTQMCPALECLVRPIQ